MRRPPRDRTDVRSGTDASQVLTDAWRATHQGEPTATPPRGGFSAPDWHGTPACLGELFHLRRTHHSAALEASCKLFSHESGWELRLELAGSLQRSQVCGSQDDVLATAERWRTSMLENDWR